jgi:hypothetical protein
MATLTLVARAILILICTLVFAPASRAAENLQLVEHQIKAGLLYNFLKYTQWPAASMPRDGSPISVCVLGGDPFGGHLRPMAGRTVNQHVIAIRPVRSVGETDGCALLFIHADEKPNWPSLQSALMGRSVLTVSDFEGFAIEGGMIEFTRMANRIGVAINTDQIAAANLMVEDRLLRLANNVRNSPGR